MRRQIWAVLEQVPARLAELLCILVIVVMSWVICRSVEIIATTGR